MNHGIINKKVYGNLISDDEMYLKYPELKKFQFYFSQLISRDRYYVALKYHVIYLCKTIYPEIKLRQIGEIINADHSTVIYYLKTYVPIIGHKVFIDKEFNHCIENGLYPETIKTDKIKNHGEYRTVTYQEHRHAKRNYIAKKIKPNKKEKNIFKRDEKEKYSVY